VISAWGSFVAEAPPQTLVTLADHGVQSDFRYYMSLLVVVMGLALVYIVKLRAKQRRTIERGSLYGCVAVFIVALLINDAPYRLVHDTNRERGAFDGQRCYIVAENGSRSLLFFPDITPPRNRIVAASDPALRRTGIEESIFTPAH
jgi:hypothetical protein